MTSPFKFLFLKVAQIGFFVRCLVMKIMSVTLNIDRETTIFRPGKSKPIASSLKKKKLQARNRGRHLHQQKKTVLKAIFLKETVMKKMVYERSYDQFKWIVYLWKETHQLRLSANRAELEKSVLLMRRSGEDNKAILKTEFIITQSFNKLQPVKFSYCHLCKIAGKTLIIDKLQSVDVLYSYTFELSQKAIVYPQTRRILERYNETVKTDLDMMIMSARIIWPANYLREVLVFIAQRKLEAQQFVWTFRNLIGVWRMITFVHHKMGELLDELQDSKVCSRLDIHGK